MDASRLAALADSLAIPARRPLRPAPAQLRQLAGSLAAQFAAPPGSLLEAACLFAAGCPAEAHAAAQAAEGHPDADYLHALVHRMEGDEANHRWWLRRLGRHPLHPLLENEIAALHSPPPETLPLARQWDGLLAARLDLSPAGPLLRRLEWRLLAARLALPPLA